MTWLLDRPERAFVAMALVALVVGLILLAVDPDARPFKLAAGFLACAVVYRAIFSFLMSRTPRRDDAR